MDNEQYTIPGLTGVDVSLPIAGPGSRSYAFVIDWHIRFVLALAWFVGAMLLEFGGMTLPMGKGNAGMGPSVLLLVFLAPTIIYFLYHPVLELLMRGQSPGKRMAGVRVVTVNGGAPGVGAVLIRNIFRLIDCLPMLYFVGLATTLLSAQRVRIGDMAAGTLLVIDERVPSKHLELDGVAGAEAEVDFATRDLIQQILERWPSLGVEKRDAIARALLKRTLGAVEDSEALDDAALHARLAALSGRR
jgi:uncharacterized RDD family membrane protein YckC